MANWLVLLIAAILGVPLGLKTITGIIKKDKDTEGWYGTYVLANTGTVVSWVFLVPTAIYLGFPDNPPTIGFFAIGAVSCWAYASYANKSKDDWDWKQK
ncbi:MAG: hypothetical protein GXP03_10990 [Alphaproteobacteria bacterium]|nr:hypothetical protein [Alphaproteobacteria bacterium]